MSIPMRCIPLTMLPVLLACASGGSSGGASPSPSYQNVLTRAELEDTGARNLYEAISRLRPRWLLVRSGMRSFSMETEVVVFQEQTYLGTQEVLERMGFEGIEAVRYLDGATAKASLTGIGDRHVQGAIVIELRRAGPLDRLDGQRRN